MPIADLRLPIPWYCFLNII